jgi:hypothetical protein
MAVPSVAVAAAGLAAAFQSTVTASRIGQRNSRLPTTMSAAVTK